MKEFQYTLNTEDAEDRMRHGWFLRSLINEEFMIRGRAEGMPEHPANWRELAQALGVTLKELVAVFDRWQTNGPLDVRNMWKWLEVSATDILTFEEICVAMNSERLNAAYNDFLRHSADDTRQTTVDPLTALVTGQKQVEHMVPAPHSYCLSFGAVVLSWILQRTLNMLTNIGVQVMAKKGRIFLFSRDAVHHRDLENAPCIMVVVDEVPKDATLPSDIQFRQAEPSAMRLFDCACSRTALVVDPPPSREHWDKTVSQAKTPDPWASGRFEYYLNRLKWDSLEKIVADRAAGVVEPSQSSKKRGRPVGKVRQETRPVHDQPPGRDGHPDGGQGQVNPKGVREKRRRPDHASNGRSLRFVRPSDEEVAKPSGSDKR